MVQPFLRRGILVAIIISASSSRGRAQEEGTSRSPELQAKDREAGLLFNTASRLYRQKNWSEASVAFADFLTRFPRHADAPEAHFARGFCLHTLGDHAHAVEDLRAAIASSGKGDVPWAAEANFYLGRSLEALARGAKGNGESGAPPSAAQSERLRAAAEAYGRAAALHARSTLFPSAEAKRDARLLALTSQAEALYQGGFLTEAAKALAPLRDEEAALKDSPHYSRGLYLLALSTLGNGKGEGKESAAAREILARLNRPGASKDPLADEAGITLARLLHREGKRAEAIEQYGRVAARAGPRAPEAAYQQALALEELGAPGDLERARAEFGKFLRDHPEHPLAPRARLQEALCLFEEKRYREAAEKLDGVARDGGALAPLASLRRGQALLLLDPPSAPEALRSLEGAVASLSTAKPVVTGAAGAAAAEDPNLPEALYWRAEALLASGGARWAEAKSAFEEFAEKRRESSRELAEKALHQAARAASLAGDRPACAALCRRYRERYRERNPGGKGRYLLESFELAAENASRAKEGELPPEELGAAAGYYRSAAELSKDPAKGRRLRYLAALALYQGGDLTGAVARLRELREENLARPLPEFQEPDLPFYLANALVRLPRSARKTADEVKRWREAEALFVEFLAAGATKEGSERTAAALFNLGLCRSWLADAAGARESFEQFLSTVNSNPGDSNPGKSTPGGAHPLAAQAHAELAALALGRGDLETALGEYRRTAEGSADPLLAARALLQAAALERRRSKPERALEAIAEAERRAAPLAAGGGPPADQARPLLAEALFQRALVHAAGGKSEEAVRELSDLLHDPAAGAREAEARLQLAGLLIDEDSPESAAKALEALEPLVSAPGSPAGQDQALYLRVLALARLALRGEGEGTPGGGVAREKEMEAAGKRLQAEYPRSEFTPEALMELGQRAYQRKVFADARRWFEAARDALPAEGAGDRAAAGGERRARCLLGLGFTLFETKDYRGARDLLDQSAGELNSPQAPRALFQAARASMLLGDDAGAVERFQRFLALEEPRRRELTEEGLLRLGECYHRLQKYAEAREALERMGTEFPEGKLRPEGLFALGFALQFLEKRDEAVALYRKVAAGKISAVAARAQYHIGECLLEQGKKREAGREFLTVAANFDFEGPCRDWVRRGILAAGMAYQEAGDPAAARAQYEDLLQRFPDSDEGRAAAKKLPEVK